MTRNLEKIPHVLAQVEDPNIVIINHARFDLHMNRCRFCRISTVFYNEADDGVIKRQCILHFVEVERMYKSNEDEIPQITE